MADVVEYNDDFLARIAGIKEAMHKKYMDISAADTPEFDGNGNRAIKTRPDGYRYIEEGAMRKLLDKYFPGWSWDMAAPLHFLGSEWVVAQGYLTIIDEYLLAFNIVPPVRRFYGTDAVQIQYKQNKAHLPENIINIGDNCQAANSQALKRAINRLTFIGDDIYGKRFEEDGAGTIEDVADNTSSKVAQVLFFDITTKRGMSIVNIKKLLGVTSYKEVNDWNEALRLLK